MSKTKVIGFMNMKGGVGKTTLCLNMAHHLSKYLNKKILVIDLDPQFNLTNIYFIIMKDFIKNKADSDNEHNEINVLMNELRLNKKSIMEIYADEFDDVNNIILKNKFESEKVEFHSNNENLHIVPSHIDLIEEEMSEYEGKVKKVKKFTDSIKNNDFYDYIFIDCPPTFSLFFRSSYEASDYIIIPVNEKPLSSLGFRLFDKATDYCVGITNTSNETEKLNKRNSKRKVLGIIYTSVDYRYKKFSPYTNYEDNYIFKSYIKEIKSISYNHQFMSENNVRKMIKDVCEEFLKKVEELSHGK